MLLKREEQGLSTPALDNREEIPDDLMPIWEAFLKLHAARPVGWGAAPLPVADIIAWLELHQIPTDDREEYYELISELDAAWLDCMRTKTSKEIKEDANTDTGDRRKEGKGR